MNDLPHILDLIKIDEFNLFIIKNDLTISTYCKDKNKLQEDWLEKYIKIAYEPNSNMIDIGANIGTTTLAMSRYISSNFYIHSFEPVYYFILERNIQQNNIEDKVKLYNFGLGAENQILKGGMIDFSLKNNYGFTRIDNLEIPDENDKYIILINTLDSFNIENVSFIKIDVEGYERKVLDGAINTIIKYLPTILIEIWSTSSNSKKNIP